MIKQRADAVEKAAQNAQDDIMVMGCEIKDLASPLQAPAAPSASASSAAAAAPADTWAATGRDPWKDGNGGHHPRGPSGEPDGGGRGPGGPGGRDDDAHDPRADRAGNYKADKVTWRTKLFDPKIAERYRFNGHDQGDAWKRNIHGFLIGQCPLVGDMLDWAEHRTMEPITAADYRKADENKEFGNLMGEDPEVLGAHIWSFLQMCCVDAAATTFQACKPRQNGLEVWRALTWEVNSGRGSRLGALQEFVSKPPAVKRYADISGALATFDGKLQDLADAGGERPKDLTLKRALLQSFPTDLREALVMRASDVEEEYATFKRVVRTKIAFILECGGGRSSPAHALEDEAHHVNAVEDVEAFITQRDDISDEAKDELLAVFRRGEGKG